MNFERLVASLYMSAMMQLGLLHEQGQQPVADLLGAKQSIDTLGVLQVDELVEEVHEEAVQGGRLRPHLEQARVRYGVRAAHDPEQAARGVREKGVQGRGLHLETDVGGVLEDLVRHEGRQAASPFEAFVAASPGFRNLEGRGFGFFQHGSARPRREGGRGVSGTLDGRRLAASLYERDRIGCAARAPNRAAPSMRARPAIGPFALPPLMIFIMSAMLRCILRSLLTSSAVVPEPAAIRRFRLALRMSDVSICRAEDEAIDTVAVAMI